MILNKPDWRPVMKGVSGKYKFLIKNKEELLSDMFTFPFVQIRYKNGLLLYIRISPQESTLIRIEDYVDIVALTISFDICKDLLNSVLKEYNHYERF